MIFLGGLEELCLVGVWPIYSSYEMTGDIVRIHSMFVCILNFGKYAVYVYNVFTGGYSGTVAQAV